MKHIKKETGFTLVELMIAVAVIGLLSAIALPAYTNYLKKANASEIVALYDQMKIHMIDYHIQNGKFPDDTGWNKRNLAVGLERVTSYETDLINKAWVGAGGLVGKDDNSSGFIKITIKDSTILAGNGSSRFVAVIEKEGGRYISYCNVQSSIATITSNIDDKYLPKRCQNQ